MKLVTRKHINSVNRKFPKKALVKSAPFFGIKIFTNQLAEFHNLCGGSHIWTGLIIALRSAAKLSPPLIPTLSSTIPRPRFLPVALPSAWALPKRAWANPTWPPLRAALQSMTLMVTALPPRSIWVAPLLPSTA